MTSNGCLNNGWSIVTSAPTNSQLAGLLAGFVFAAVTLLISRPGSKNTQALGLLSSAFVVLAFDSYLFSLVSGSTSDTVCARPWSEGMLASGMLAVGGLAVVTGISWLLAGREVPESEPGPQEQDATPWRALNLDRLARFMAHGVAVAVTLLLAATTASYISIAFPKHVPYGLEWSVTLPPAIVGVTSVTLSMYRGRTISRASLRVSVSAFNLASYGVLAYGVACPLYAGLVTNLPGIKWDTEPVIPVTTISLGLYVPSLLLIALVQSVAPAARPAQPRIDPAASNCLDPSCDPPQLPDVALADYGPADTGQIPDPPQCTG